MAAIEYERPGMRQDSVRQPFTRREMAERCAEILERMTGDSCWVFSRGTAWHLVERITAEGKVERG
jgi:hypothetical protein